MKLINETERRNQKTRSFSCFTSMRRQLRTYLPPVTGFLCPHLDMPQNKIKKLGNDVCALGRLLEELETCVGRQKEHLHQLKVRMEACS